MIDGVLIIDDNEEMIDTLKSFLEIYGLPSYKVFVSLDPMDGLEIFRQQKDIISLVICDYYMPKSNGAELCEIIKKNKPSISVILHTGDHNIRLENLNFIDYVLHKPYDYDAIKEVIDASEAKEQEATKIEQEGPPEFDFKRCEKRYLEGKFQVGVVRIDKSSSLIHGVILNQSKSGCRLAINTTSKLKPTEQVEFMQGSFDLESMQYRMEKAIRAEVVWINIVNIDVCAVGLKYLE
ncbi:MAG: response regulator [Halobacteriovoraceae bacterium]|jgi:CheY-like chemotaxis protein|nr:response regulator [Halobacteriovoraceae bacterium]